MKMIKKLNKKNRFILASCLALVLTIAIVFTLKATLASPTSTDIPDKMIDGILFENAKLEYEDGITTLIADAYNENKETFNLKYVKVTFTNENNKTTTIKAYIGESIEPKEGKKLIVSTDADINNSTAISYSIVK